MFAIVHSLVLLRDSHNVLYVMSMIFIPLTFIYAGIGYYAVSEIQCYISHINLVTAYLIIELSEVHFVAEYLRALNLKFIGRIRYWESDFFSLFHTQEKKDYIFLTFLHFFNPLHPIISMHILHTVLCTFPKVLTRRICLSIKSLFNW